MSYIRDRMIQALVTIVGIVTLAFFLNKMIPGGPVDWLRERVRRYPIRVGLPRNPTQQQVDEIVRNYVNIDPAEPLHIEYVIYMRKVFLEGNLGESIIVARGEAVTALVLTRAPWTIFLSAIGLVYGLLVGIVLGAVMAYYEGTKFDVSMTVAMILDNSVPYYIAAVFLLFVFGFQLEWFPTGGRFNPDTTPGLNWPFLSSVLYYATLPVLSFVVTGFGGGALGIRANSIRLLGSEYIRGARLRGLSTYRIAMSYLARNAILPRYTSIVLGFGGLLGGSVVLETIFQYPGMGLIMFKAATARDFPVLMGVFIITSFIFVLGTIVADFTYSMVDPRADVKVSRE